MMRLRRASVIAALSLLAWAATAGAECARVLWEEMLNTTTLPTQPPTAIWKIHAATSAEG